MSTYKGLGHYDPQPKQRNGLLLALVVAAVVVIGVAATLLFVNVQSTTPGQALPAADAVPKPTTKPKDPLQPKSTGAPKVPGWQVIPISNGSNLDTDKAYDVPPGFSPIAGGLVDFGDHNEVSLVAPTIYKQGYCAASAKSWRAMAGLLTAPTKGNLEFGAAAAANQVANGVFTTEDRVQPKTELSDPEPVTILRGTKAVVVTAKLTVPVTEKDTCGAPNVTVVVMMIEPKDMSQDAAVMVAMGDQNVPEAMTEDQLKQIVTSFHTVS